MNRRKAIRGIIGLSGVGVVSFAGYRFFYASSKVIRGQLDGYSNVLAELVDVIIPTTETPGAKDAKVHKYIIAFMESCSSNKEYYNFLKGLQDLQKTCLNDYNSSFVDCSLAQKNSLVARIDSDFDAHSLWSKIDNKIRGRSFFTILKSLTIEGYCSSREGATQLLVYQAVPGGYDAITTIQPGQKAWATS